MPEYVISRPTYFKRWRSTAAVALVLLLAGVGSWVAGQYQIGRLDSIATSYHEPINDYAATIAKLKPESVEYELLDSCKQVQIGTWLQTTDALTFKDPISGNRILVQLEAGKDYIDINGRELTNCISDEVENRQYNISSMTNTWAIILVLLGLITGAVAFVFRRRMLDFMYGVDDTPHAVHPAHNETIHDAVVVVDEQSDEDEDEVQPTT